MPDILEIQRTCEHKTIVGGNDCRWCPDCGEDLPPAKGAPQKPEGGEASFHGLVVADCQECGT